MRTIAILLSMAALALAPPMAQADDKEGAEEASAGYLGIHLQRIEGGLAEALDLDEDSGVLVRQVEDDSPAAQAGLKAGDIVTKIDDENTGDPMELRSAIRSHSAGDDVKIHYLRDGKSRDVTVTLAAAEDNLGLARQARRYAHKVRDKLGRADHEVRELRFHGDHGYLGVSTQTLSGGLGEYFGVQDNHGALVAEVVEDSPAEKLGLKAGDVIVEVADEEIDDPGKLSSVVRSYEEPETVEVRWVRDGKKMDGKVELEIREGTSMKWFDDSGLGNLDLGHLFGGHGPKGMQRHVEIHGYDEGTAEAMEDLREELDDLRETVKELQQKVK